MSLEDLTVPELLERTKKLERENSLFTTLMNAPDTREETLKLIRKKNPNMPIPELDSKQALEARLDEERKSREALEQQIREDRALANVQKAREAARKRFDLTEEDMVKVEEIMMRKEEPIPHYDAAAKVYVAERQLAKPTTASIQPPIMKMPEDQRWKKGIGNNTALRKTSMELAYEALDQFRAGKAA